jgi:hypothetical protein
MKGNKETCNFFNITLHISCPPHPCSKKVLLYHPQEVKEVELNLVQTQGDLETSLIENPTQKCGIILFFTFFRAFVSCTLVFFK